MPVVSVRDMAAIESAAKSKGWTEEHLLRLAGTALGHAIARFFPQTRSAVAYLGKGHNAGDAIVALEVLKHEYGWEVGLRPGFPAADCAPLTRKLLESSPLAETFPASWETPPKYPLLVIDGLLGLGSKGPPRQPIADLVEEIRHLRDRHGAWVASVDLPSGMNADTGEPEGSCVTADLTLMIAHPKQGLLTPQAVNFTGALAIVPLKALTTDLVSDSELICPQHFCTAKSPIPHDVHKGDSGRVSLLVGSDAYPGAAVLAAIGALRGGGGWITLHVPRAIVDRIAPRCPPEVIVRGYDDLTSALEHPADSWVVGCGMGSLPAGDATALLDWIGRSSPVPTVLDADALNLIARHGKSSILRQNHVITPHPGEFKRLFPAFAGLSRDQQVRQFTHDHPATLLLKGARTLVHQRGGRILHNSTGHPGMASGGQGDLLAGLIGALLARSTPPLDAAALGAWICGRASEIAIWQSGQSAESLTASDTAAHFGSAFADWRSSQR